MYFFCLVFFSCVDLCGNQQEVCIRQNIWEWTRWYQLMNTVLETLDLSLHARCVTKAASERLGWRL